MLDQDTTPQTLGADIRALRKARGLTLATLADQLGRSVGWLSQVERDLSDPGISDLRELAGALDVSVSSLFGTGEGPSTEAGHVVRAANRRPIGSREAGLVEELLSPDLTDDFEVLHSVFEPGAALPKPNQRPTQEVGYIISGNLTLWIGDEEHHLAQGDSFRIRGQEYRWQNPSPTNPCAVIWVIAPPVY